MASAYDIVLKPIITENTMDLAQAKKYTFKVAKDATRTQVKNAVEQAFEVEVAKVNIVNVNGKAKRLGRTACRTAAYKKAIVTLTENSKTIEFFEGL